MVDEKEAFEVTTACGIVERNQNPLRLNAFFRECFDGALAAFLALTFFGAVGGFPLSWDY